MNKIISRFTKSKKNLEPLNNVFFEIFTPDFLKSVAKITNADDQRERKLTITSFTFLMILGHSLGKKIELQELADKAVEWKLINDISISKQRISQQIDERGVDYFKKLFEHLLRTILDLNHDSRRQVKKYFKNIFAIDSTTIELVHKMINKFRGTKKQAAIKIHTKYDIQNKVPIEITLTEAKKHDSNVSFDTCFSKETTLYLRDLGYYDFDLFKNMDRKGDFFVSRVKNNIVFKIIEDNININPITGNDLVDLKKLILKEYDLLVELTNGLRVRLVGVFDKEEKEYRFYITNLLDNFDWSIKEIIFLYKNRWSIEIFFRDLKVELGCFKIMVETKERIESQVWAGLVFFVFIRVFMAIVSIRSKINIDLLSFKRCLKILIKIMLRYDFALKLGIKVEIQEIIEIVITQSDKMKKNIF